MGNYMTKLFHPNESQKENELQAVKQQVATDSSLCTPLSQKKMLCDPRSVSAGILRTPIEAVMQDSDICTPTLPNKKVLCDPRSISVEISRTPIEVKCTPVTTTKRTLSAIPEYLQKKKYLETDMDVVMPPLTPKKCVIPKIDSDQGSESDGAQDYLTPNINVIEGPKSITPIDKERYTILGLDPRSPAADFDRTPILMPKSLVLIKARAKETLSRRGSYESDIYNPTNSYREINTFNIPKIQVLSDTASEIPETLDMETQNESHILCTSQQSDVSVIESEEEITVIKNPNCKSEKEKSLILGEQTVATGREENKDNADKKDNCKDIEDDMKTMHIKDDNKIEVWHDSVSLEENITGKKEKENIVEKLLQKKATREDVIIMFDECAVISTLPKPIKTEEDCQKKGDIVEKKKSMKIDATVLSNEKKIFNPENKMHGTEILKNRIPFGNRSNNDQVQKINSPKHLSRNKTVSTQQENTPPYKMYNAKTKNGHHWDPNATVLI
ncbi:uncharacterized protein LOC126852351 [Cataglyphis hispanica]|uniref:uncharacterized protein LOC126852351 n=1 Tax=Cataglyphis hispanica TaxID=1086592 RepID=UPI00217FF17D|nr:uncharacterized protein LOC126852351 [Cataglyphis hispanica]XP_050453044.1 uncharacterized protein LOC126852351 [Cataglyphis hispanica]XP_050453045.1 uncharacterized protein LOC126852351 [Cataglyphis hispanica]